MLGLYGSRAALKAARNALPFLSFVFFVFFVVQSFDSAAKPPGTRRASRGVVPGRGNRVTMPAEAAVHGRGQR